MARAQIQSPDVRPLLVILALALVLRLGWGLSRPANNAAIDQLPDQRGYLEAARHLLAGEGLWYFDERFDQRVYAMRTPGYPLFIATCGGSVRMVRAMQALIDTSTALAIYLLARLLLRAPSASQRAAGTVASGEDAMNPRFRHLAALFACTLVAFNPFLVYFSGLLLTETLYTAMLAWAMVLLPLSRRGGWLMGVLLLVLGIHVRPSGMGLPVVLGVAAISLRLMQARRSGETPAPSGARHPSPALQSVAGAALAGLATLLVLLPWALRNDRVLGRWVWSTTNDGITAYDGFHAGATGASDQSFVARMPEVQEMGELQRSDYFAAEAKRFIRENPGRVAELTAAKLARTWSPVPLSAEFGTPLHRAVALIFSLPFAVLVIAGIAAGRLRRRVKVFLLLPALYFTAIHALSVGSLRYRVPAEPPLAVLAAAGAARLFGGAGAARLSTTAREDDALRASSSTG